MPIDPDRDPFAFPDPRRRIVGPAIGAEPDAGMTLRDFFAAHALAGLLATQVTDDLSRKAIAETAWDFADAMMIRRPAGD